MKDMPLPFVFEGKEVLDFAVADSSSPAPVSSYFSGKNCLLRSDSFGEPISVLDSGFPGEPSSSSTLSSSLCGGGGGSTGGWAASTDTAGVAAVSDRNESPKWQQYPTTATSSSGGVADSGLVPVPPSLEIGGSSGGDGGNMEKCAMEDWESVLSESATESPCQEQSIFRWIMGDVEDPAIGCLHKVLQIGGGGGCSAASEFEFGDGFGVMDQAFVEDHLGADSVTTFSNFSNSVSTAEKIDFASNTASPSPVLGNLVLNAANPQAAFDSSAETKPPVFDPQLLINQQQAQHAQNPSFFMPFSFAERQDQSAFIPPVKRLNSGGPIGPAPKWPSLGTRHHEMFIGRHQLNYQPQAPSYPLQLLPHHPHQWPTGPGFKIGSGDELQQQQAIIDQLYMAAELLQTGNAVLARGILARLNHHLSPVGRPFRRAAFYCKEALQLLLDTDSNMNRPSAAVNCSPFRIILKIGAYKSFSEISPLIEFSNFTCNQALLEVLEGFDRIHIVDFDIGYGAQWASLMQELALRNGGAPFLKISALASPSTHDQLELSLTRENLIQFANEINIGFEFEVISIDCLSLGSWPLPHVPENESIAVNLPVGCLTDYQFPVPLVLRFVKQLSPRIIVSVDRGCDRNDISFANHIIHALHLYSNLLESLDAANVNMDALQKIERFLLQPGIEKTIMGRFHTLEKSQHWRTLFLSSGFSPVPFSNFNESQADCVVKRAHVRGFHVEKRQSSLVLCWQRKELISASVWRC